jgi:hypothetical protein
MQMDQDFGWCRQIAEHLPNVTIINHNQYPLFAHSAGLHFRAWQHGTRRQFSILPIHALDGSNRPYPNTPPNPITVDSRRTPPRIAAEIQRRLITPGLTWCAQAHTWQAQDAAEQQRHQAIRNLLISLGGSAPSHTELIYGYAPSWTAQINTNGTVTLCLKNIGYEHALDIIEQLQKEM